MIRITGGKLVTPFEVLEGVDLLIDQGIIEGTCNPDEEVFPDEEKWDAQGGYILPGFIDLHSDYIEHIAAPRPTSMMDFRLSLHEAERELIAHGVSTMYHSLSLFKTSVFDTKPIRKPENVQKLAELIHQTHHEKHLIRHRFHARFEIDNPDMVELLTEYLQQKKIHLLSFMDHTPGQGQYRDLEMFRHTIKGYRNLSEKELDVMVAQLQNAEKITLETIEELADLAQSQGIPIASHDDDSIEKIDLIRSFGTKISEFPITLDVARYATEKGMYTIAGAPNVLLGGSHSGNLSAAEAVLDGSVNILCSDYYPAAMLHAVFQLHEKYNQDLVEMVKLVSLNPARAVSLDHEIGSIEEGKKADLLIVKKLEDGFPAVTGAMVDGHIVFSTHYRS